MSTRWLLSRGMALFLLLPLAGCPDPDVPDSPTPLPPGETPTLQPTDAPTQVPTPAPTSSPTLAPTPTDEPTEAPTVGPTLEPTPTLVPTPSPTPPDQPTPTDLDGDGWTVAAGDCHDGDPDIHPEALEICDGIDNDCSGAADLDAVDAQLLYPDEDGDGFGNGEAGSLSCPLEGLVSDATDCDDIDDAVYPGADERCNDIDDDCDDLIDEGTTQIFYTDGDGDGFGDPAAAFEACTLPMGAASNALDCDDTSSLVYPDAVETCNGIDDDCDGLIDQEDNPDAAPASWYLDQDGDTFGAGDAVVSCISPGDTYVLMPGDCLDTDPLVSPDALEQCNGYDDDCDGLTDDEDDMVIDPLSWYPDRDGDGFGDSPPTLACLAPESVYLLTPGDCDDTDPLVSPDGLEVCNGYDDDCDSLIDDNDPSVSDQSQWYADGDGDDFGAGSPTQACLPPTSGHVLVSGDCDDANPAASPAGLEACNGFDDDCDGLIDDEDDAVADPATWYLDEDGDGYAGMSSLQSCQKPADDYYAASGDCDDALADISPAATEICNGVDDDCDGLTDDSDSSVADQPRWYQDADQDGYGSQLSLLSCEPVDGYVDNADDCDDTDPAINPETSWYEDADGDGFGDASSGLTQCLQPTDGVWVMTGGDCNDGDSSLNPNTAWYPDVDQDGYGDPDGDPALACTLPTGYVENQDDCNDASAQVHPGATEICDKLDNDCEGTVDQVQGQQLSCVKVLHYHSMTNGSFTGTGGYGYSSLAASYTALGAILSESTVTLTDTVLNAYDVVMVGYPNHTPSSDEVAALKRFVQRGGGLFVQTGWTGGSEYQLHNAFTTPFGITYGSSLVNGSCTPSGSHPLTQGITNLSGQGGFLTTVSSGAVGLCGSAAPYYLAASEAFGGRVVVWFDEWIWFNSGSGYGWENANHQKFARNLLVWLAKR